MTALATKVEPSTRLVYSFDDDAGGGRELLGGKGLGLSEMAHLGMPVPDGFTITTDACRAYLATGGELPRPRGRDPRAISSSSSAHRRHVRRPVQPAARLRSLGAAISMPGMMDTILDLGLNDEPRRAGGRDGQRPVRVRLLPAPDPDVRRGRRGDRRRRFEHALDELKARARRRERRRAHRRRPHAADRPLQADLRAGGGASVPDRTRTSSCWRRRAVFDSWNSPRARVYRQTYGIPDNLGTAVNVMQMVFGNRGDDCGTGVASAATPPPATGHLRRVPRQRAG